MGVTGGWVVEVVVLGTAGSWCRCAGAVWAAGDSAIPQLSTTSAPTRTTRSRTGDLIVTRPSVARVGHRRTLTPGALWRALSRIPLSTFGTSPAGSRRRRWDSGPAHFHETVTVLPREGRREHDGTTGTTGTTATGTGRRLRSSGVRAPSGQGRGAPAGGVRSTGTTGPDPHRPEADHRDLGPRRRRRGEHRAAGSTMPSDGAAWCCTTGRSAAGAPTSTTSWWCPRGSGWSTPSTTGAGSSGGTRSGGWSRVPGSSWPVATGPRSRRPRAASRYWWPRHWAPARSSGPRCASPASSARRSPDPSWCRECSSPGPRDSAGRWPRPEPLGPAERRALADRLARAFPPYAS